MAGAWKPWRALRERDDIDLLLTDMPDGASKGMLASRAGRHVIIIDRDLSPVDRLAVLAHEMVHLERGGSGHEPDMPEAMRPVVNREEARVDDEVTPRLVPAEELVSFSRRQAELEGCCTADDVVAEFDVPHHVAERAIRGLGDEGHAA